MTRDKELDRDEMIGYIKGYIEGRLSILENLHLLSMEDLKELYDLIIDAQKAKR